MINFIKQDILKQGGIKNYLYHQQTKGMLRFITCGSVDDGKSTLIGRLLYDLRKIPDDQLSTLYIDSKKIGLNKNTIDFSLLVDGLQLERAQGITVDVAYRYFCTKKRTFILADTPGHEEYTKNMVTGASTSELAILLIDVRKGINDQTKRHWLINTLLGIRHIIVAINKMDLIKYDQKFFDKIRLEYLKYIKNSNVINTVFIPISAIHGDNIQKLSVNMNWYKGPTILDILENIVINPVINLHNQKFRFPVQYVIRNHLDFRGYAGTITSGRMYVGQKIKVFPSNNTSVIQRIILFNKDYNQVGPGMAVTVTLKDNIDISRGNILIDLHDTVVSTQYALVDVVWMASKTLKSGQYFSVKINSKILRVQIVRIRYHIDMHTFKKKKTDSIFLNGVGLVELFFDEPLILDKYSEYPVTGNMIFIDLLTNETVGAGMIRTPIMNEKKNFNKNLSKFEVELHELIRRHFPHWNVCDLF